MRIFIILNVCLPLFFYAAAPSIEDQWARSPHAGSMDNAEERVTMNKTGCAHCHTAQGYREVILQGKQSTAPYKNAVGITCTACHYDDKKSGPGSPGLRAGKVETACTGCHDILVQNDEKGFSSCPQGSILEGKGGAEWEGKTYRTGAHSNIEKNCAGCHMAQSPAGKDAYKTGGHTFRVISKGEKPRVLNINGCTRCHETMSYQFVKESQAKIKKQMQTLAALLPQKEEGTFKRPEESPKFPKDPSLDKVQAKAAYNYYIILKDGTYSVHNPVYIQKLLQDSIAALRK